MLVFLVGERLRWRDGDRITGVDAHRVHIFDRANHDKVVAIVAHHLEFEFFPTENGLLDQRLMHRAGIESARDQVGEFFAIVSNRAARAAHRERRTDDDGIAELVGESDGFGDFGDDFGSRNFEADTAADVFEEQAVFRDFDRVQRRAEKLDIIFCENARFGELDGEVQRGLAADGRKHGVWPFDRDDGFKIFLRERLDVSAVGDFGVGHDRRGIRIDEDDFEAFGAQRFARLRAGVIEFAGLADDDRAGADNQNFLDVVASWHYDFPSINFVNWSNK